MVVGGDTLGYQIVKRFEDRELSTQLVERDPERAAWLANQLQGSTVVEADATNVEEFGREQLPDIDLIVSGL